jgi:hypothetical protein
MDVGPTFDFDLIARKLLEYISRDDTDIIDYLTQQFQTYQAGRAQGSQQLQFQGYYRVTVSAHGLDICSSQKKFENVEATFMFQQPEHSFSAYACSTPIQGTSLTYCDFRTRVFWCISQIMCGTDRDAIREFQKGVFDSLYKIEKGDAVLDKRRFGSGQSFVDEQHPLMLPLTSKRGEIQICRRYDLTPSSISSRAKQPENQLEYTDSHSHRSRVWLAPGISVSSDLIDMCKRDSDLGLEVSMITSNYGIFIGGSIPQLGCTQQDVFDLLRSIELPELVLRQGRSANNPDQEQLDRQELLREIKSRHEKYNSCASANRNDAKQLLDFFQQYIDIDLTGIAISTSDQLLDAIFILIDRGQPIRIDPPTITDEVRTFLDKYTGNLDTMLSDAQIEEICNLPKSVLCENGERIVVERILSISLEDAGRLVIFMRKVFILDELAKHLSTNDMSPTLSITSDEIIAIVAEYHGQQMQKIPGNSNGPISIEFFDQTCRDCGMKKCKHASHIDSNPSDANTTKKTRRGGTRRKTQKTKKTNKVRNVKRGTKLQFRTVRKRKYRSKINYTY